MASIIIQTKQQMEATGKARGAIISYEDAPEWMRRQHDSLHSEVSEDMALKIRWKSKEAIDFAGEYRSCVESVMDCTGTDFATACDSVNRLIECASR